MSEQQQGFDPDRASAQDNTILQLEGAEEFLTKAGKALMTSLELGGELNTDEQRALLHRLSWLTNGWLQLMMVLNYRHGSPLYEAARQIGLTEEQGIRVLAQHLQENREFTAKWLTARLEQSR